MLNCNFMKLHNSEVVSSERSTMMLEKFAKQTYIDNTGLV